MKYVGLADQQLLSCTEQANAHGDPVGACLWPTDRIAAPTRAQQLHHEHGVSLVEFALVLPLFLLILLGMVDLGQGFNRYLVMLNATREGAVWLARHPTDLPGMEARIAGEIQQSGLTLENIVVTRTPQKGAYASGELVKITLEYKYTLMFGAITRIPSLTLHTEHTIQVQ